MKKSLLIALSVMLVFGLAVAVYAFQSNNLTTVSDKTAACAKHQSEIVSAHKSGDIDSCCRTADCCKDGNCSMGGACCKSSNSCPMKDKKESSTADVDYSKVTFSDVNSEDCCASGASCCQNGASCCNGKHS
jgi:hypothetical protein